MNGAYMAVAAASLTAGAAVFYAHYNQITERARMHEGVLRDIAKEEAEKQQQQLLLQAKLSSSTSSTSTNNFPLPSNATIPNLTPNHTNNSNVNYIASSSSSPSGTSSTISSADCDSGICDLSQRRIRPTGQNDITPLTKTSKTHPTSSSSTLK